MFHSTNLRRTPAALAVGAIAVLSLAGPAPASDHIDVGAAKHGGVEVPPTVDVRRLLNDIDTPLPPATTTEDPGPSVVLVDDDALEYVQITVAAVAGAALTAAGLGTLAARRRHVSRPA